MTKTNDVELIVVGNELLKGERTDAHVAFIGRSLIRIGIQLAGAHLVGDDRRHIADLVRERMAHTRVVLVSGGLGPTHDDVTREGVAEGLGLALEYREEEWAKISALFERMGRTPDESNRGQAHFPTGAQAIPNANGTAPGFAIDIDGCLVVVLPGPPKELNAMVEETVMPMVAAVFDRPPLFTETFRTTGIAESTMVPVVQPVLDKFGEFQVSFLPNIGGVDIVLTGSSGADLTGLEKRATLFEKELREALGTKIYARGNTPLGEAIGAELAKRNATLAIAESITGGLIGKMITDVPGSSRYLLADVVAYSNDDKERFLGVAGETLEENGAVSEPVCREMAAGIRNRSGSTFGLATTGIAGPGGGTESKQLGLCYYGLTWENGAAIRKKIFPGNRDAVRHRCAYATLFLLWEQLQRS